MREKILKKEKQVIEAYCVIGQRRGRSKLGTVTMVVEGVEREWGRKKKGGEGQIGWFKS